MASIMRIEVWTDVEPRLSTKPNRHAYTWEFVVDEGESKDDAALCIAEACKTAGFGVNVTKGEQ